MTSHDFENFWKLPLPHRHAFYYLGSNTVVTKSLNPSTKTMTSFLDDPQISFMGKVTFTHADSTFQHKHFQLLNRKFSIQNALHCSEFLPWLSKTTLVWPSWLWKRIHFSALVNSKLRLTFEKDLIEKPSKRELSR
jgi:hypothetical protein